MEMNKNKLIFAIIWWVILLFILFIVSTLNNSSQTPTSKTSSEPLTIWTVWPQTWWMQWVIDDFKTIYTEYKNQVIVVENFTSYDDYTYALTSAIVSGRTPDIFVLNNNEKDSIFSSQVVAVQPDKVNPNDFRKRYQWVFWDDLIFSSWEWEEAVEYLWWIPVWYESLWIFYNRRYVKQSELESLSWLNNIVAELKDEKPNITPIGIWNGSTVKDAWDIVTQFFMLEDGVTKLSDVSGTKLKQGLTSYRLYWDTSGRNQYDSHFDELKNLGRNAVDLFSRWETFMVVWYPSLIQEIWEKWFSKNFLLATPFPHYFSWNGKTLINYYYFVINKDSSKQEIANDFLAYLSSDNWADSYLSNHTYLLPALLSLESDKLEEKIDDDYNIVLWDFYNEEHQLSSFDKWIKSLYDREILPILDITGNYEEAFKQFQQRLICKSNKISTLENLSTSCD